MAEPVIGHGSRVVRVLSRGDVGQVLTSRGTDVNPGFDEATGGGSGITQLTGDVTAGPGSGSVAATIANDAVTTAKILNDAVTNPKLANDAVDTAEIVADAVTNAKLANMAESTVKGRAAGAGTGDPTDLTATQATAVLNTLVGDSGSGGTKGLAPAPAAGDAAASKFLKADATWAVPSVPASSLGDLLDFKFVSKTGDESVTNNTLQADDELTFPVAAGETWEFEFHVVLDGVTGADAKVGLKFPTSPTQISYAIFGPDLGVSGASGVGIWRGGFTADAVGGLGIGTNAASGTPSIAFLKGFVVNGSNAGSVTLWWAQQVTDATATKVKAGSYLTARRVA